MLPSLPAELFYLVRYFYPAIRFGTMYEIASCHIVSTKPSGVLVLISPHLPPLAKVNRTAAQFPVLIFSPNRQTLPQKTKTKIKQNKTKMPQQLGLPRLPITGTWAAPFTLYYLVLSSRVLFERLRSEVFVGDYAAASAATATATANNSPTAPTAASGPGLVTLRGIHSNFNENVPLGFIL